MALKNFNPTTPGRRRLVLIDRSDLWKGDPVKKLTEGLTKSGGRNNHGRMTARRRGGGHKSLYRMVDFKRRKFDMPATVASLEYDPNRSACIDLIEDRQSGVWVNSVAVRVEHGERRSINKNKKKKQ